MAMFKLNKLLGKLGDQDKDPNKDDSRRGDRIGPYEDSDSAEGFICPSCRLSFPCPEDLQAHYSEEHDEDSPTTKGDRAEEHLLQGNIDSLHLDEEMNSLHVAANDSQRELSQKMLLQSEALRFKEMENQKLIEVIKGMEIEIQQRPSADDVAVLKSKLIEVQKIMDQKILEAEAEKINLEKENCTLKEQNQELQVRKSELETMIESFQADMDEAKAKGSQQAVDVAEHEELKQKHCIAVQAEIQEMGSNEWEGKMKEMKDKLHSQNEKINELQTKIIAYREECQKTKSSLEVAEAALKKKSEQLEDQERRASVLISQLEERKKTSSAQLEQTNQLIADMTLELETMRQESRQLVSEMNLEVENLRQVKEALTEKVEDQAKQIVTCETEVALVMEENDHLKEQYQKYKRDYEEEKSTNINLSANLDSSRRDNADLREKLQEAEAQCTAARDFASLTQTEKREEINAVQKEKEEVLKDLEKTKNMLASVTVERNERIERMQKVHADELADQAQQLLASKHKMDKLHDDYEVMAAQLVSTRDSAEEARDLHQHELMFLQAKVKTLEDGQETLKVDFTAEQIAHEELKRHFDEVNGSKLELEAKLAVSNEERNALLTRVLTFESQVEQLHKQNGELRAMLEDANAALQELARENQALKVERVKQSDRKWASDSDITHCTSCGKAFTVTLRKHHCRICGNIFCNDCSSKTAQVASSKDPKRVCDACYNELTK